MSLTAATTTSRNPWATAAALLAARGQRSTEPLSGPRALGELRSKAPLRAAATRYLVNLSGVEFCRPTLDYGEQTLQEKRTNETGPDRPNQDGPDITNYKRAGAFTRQTASEVRRTTTADASDRVAQPN